MNGAFQDQEILLARLGVGGEGRWIRRGRGNALQPSQVALRDSLKRLLDVTVCLVSLPVVIPTLALCAVAIRIESPGPVIFVQRRTGRDGKRFSMLKLRTMVQDAEQLKEKLRELNALGFPDFKITDDPRVTRVGRWLRRTSLDELPQVFNVLKGEMTIVGPRPTSFHPSTYSLWHTARLAATPGLTGLWQISGRSEIGFDERSRLDIAYIRDRSTRLDVEIMVRTIGSVIGGRGAG